jgi:hypothetical protein
LRSIVESALARSRGLGAGDVVLDIASNDGTLLSAYPPGCYRVGIDPAQNIVPQGADLHINTYFSKEAYFSHVERKAKIVTSIAMFYDLEDPVQFSCDVAAVLELGGLWIIELSYLPTMLELNAFDTICAEHLEYYSLRSIEYILHKARLRVEEVEKNGVNGGSFRLYVRHEEYVTEHKSVEAMRQEELVLDLSNLKIYREFQERIERNKEEMLKFLHEQKRLGKKVIGYGASTKGNTLLAYYGIGPELLLCVADRNPMKWGLETVTRIPILSEEEARALEPDFFLAFPYHFMEEFLERESAFLSRGGKFLSPVPQLVLV